MIASVSILIVTAALIAGLYTGAMQALRLWVEEIGLAKTIHVASTQAKEKRLFDQERLVEFREIEVAGRRPIQAVHGWNDANLIFVRSDGRPHTQFTEGRSVEPEDPLLRELEFLSPRPGDLTALLPNAVEPRIIVSAALLRILGYEHEDPARFPEFLRIEYGKGNSSARLAVAGVCRSTPRGDFLFSSRFHRALQDEEWEPDPEAPYVLIGPIPGAKNSNVLLSQNQVQDYLSGPMVQVKAEPVEHLGEAWVKFTRDGHPWTVKQWEERFLGTVAEKMGLAAANLTHEFGGRERDDSGDRRQLQPMRFLRASVYVTALEDVPAVVDGLAGMGQPESGDAKSLAQLFLQAQRFSKGVLVGVLAIVGSLASITIFLSFYQSIQRKGPEVGILRAYGAGTALIVFVYVASSALVWVVAFAIGAPLASALAGIANGQIRTMRGFSELASNPDFQPIQVSAVLIHVGACSIVLCVGASLWASFQAARILPAEALRGLR